MLQTYEDNNMVLGRFHDPKLPHHLKCPDCGGHCELGLYKLQSTYQCEDCGQLFRPRIGKKDE